MPVSPRPSDETPLFAGGTHFVFGMKRSPACKDKSPKFKAPSK
jgi:hypothetical protein